MKTELMKKLKAPVRLITLDDMYDVFNNQKACKTFVEVCDIFDQWGYKII